MDAKLLATLNEQLPTDVPVLFITPSDALAQELRQHLAKSRLLESAAGIDPLKHESHYAGALVRITADRSAEDWRILLAALRDRLAGRTLVLLGSDSSLQPADCTALGFRLIAHAQDWQLFRFDLYDYKDRPEWFSPKDWAHPELWDKHRW